MNRCGVVRHPREWDWGGYHEIMGLRRRYQLIDRDQLCWRLGTNDIEEVRRNLEVSLAKRIEGDPMKRGPWWKESLAVGSAGFVEKIRPLILSRRDTERGDDSWVLQEVAMAYGQKAGSKSAAKRAF